MARGNKKRGLANSSKETRMRVARAGGQAHHNKRGQHGSDKKSMDDQTSDNIL